MVARRRRKVIVDARSELIGAVPQIGDVAVGECDVLAGGSAVILVRGPARVVFSGPELTEGFRGVEDAGHGPARIDLEERIADQVTGLVVVGEHASGEGVVGGLDAVAVVASGRAADVFTAGEEAVVIGEGVQTDQPVFVGVFVGEARVVGA
jgi:hypothetical protein